MVGGWQGVEMVLRLAPFGHYGVVEMLLDYAKLRPQHAPDDVMWLKPKEEWGQVGWLLGRNWHVLSGV